MLPDRAFDFYEIAMWDDLRYRVRRTYIRGKGEHAVERHHYLTRDAGGGFIWVDEPEKAEAWEAVQAGALSLIWVLNQHGVNG